MNGVKGLIIKEIYLRRKSMLSGFTILILLFILAASYCLSFDYGNMKNDESIDRDVSTTILAYTIAAVGGVVLGQNAETIAKDRKCKWNTFEYTLPLSPQKLAAVRTGLLSASSILGFILSILFSLIIFTLAHKDFTLSVFANISLINMLIFIMMVSANYTHLKYGDPQKALTRMLLWLFALYFVAGIVVYKEYTEIQKQFAGLSDEEIEKMIVEKYMTPAAEIRDRLFPFFILIFAAIAAVGYFLFLKQYKRREK